MPTLTIEVPKKILERSNRQHFVVIDPVEYERELRSRLEFEDVKYARNIAGQEVKHNKARKVRDLRELM